MTPQSNFLVLATVDPQHEERLRTLLLSMNDAPGRARGDNELVPFAAFDQLHYARFLMVEDETLDDVRAYRLPRRDYPLYLAFLGDVDGDARTFLAELARVAGDGLRSVFACCAGFSPGNDVLAWMIAHQRRPAAQYVNWRGRTVRQVREEAALSTALQRFIDQNNRALADLPPREVHARLRDFVDTQRAQGGLTLTPDAPTPLGWSLSNAAHFAGVGMLLLLLLPVLVLISPIALYLLRRREKSDPEMCFRVDQRHSDALALLEDRDVVNQFSALSAVKPGLVRAWFLALVLLVIDFVARHFYVRGRLARVRTIHFARWVWIDPVKRMAFLSNYDGSLEGYMDDFINKVGFGLNIVFCNAIGYPRTNWLICDGCRDERKFKEYLRRHQLPTQVWYAAYRDLTAVDLERNTLIRRGIEASSLSEREAHEWVSLF